MSDIIDRIVKSHEDKIKYYQSMIEKERDNLSHELFNGIHDNAKKHIEKCKRVDGHIQKLVPLSNDELDTTKYEQPIKPNTVLIIRENKFLDRVFKIDDNAQNVPKLLSDRVVMGLYYAFDEEHKCYFDEKNDEFIVTRGEIKKLQKCPLECADNDNTRFMENVYPYEFEVDNYLNLYHKRSGTYFLINATPFPLSSFFVNTQRYKYRNDVKGYVMLQFQKNYPFNQDILQILPSNIQQICDSFTKFKKGEIYKNEEKLSTEDGNDSKKRRRFSF